MGRSIRYAACFAIGALAGPVLIAGGLSLVPSNSIDSPVDAVKAYEAERLINAYRARLPRGILFSSIVPPPYGKECGYDSKMLLPDTLGALAQNPQDRRWTDITGYYALNDWRSRSRDEAWISDITRQIADDMPLPRIKFLRMCIEATVFSRACMAEVAQYGDRVERFKKGRKNPGSIASGQEDRVVCTYVDGVAARRGLPLSPAFDQKLADQSQLGGN